MPRRSVSHGRAILRAPPSPVKPSLIPELRIACDNGELTAQIQLWGTASDRNTY